MKIDEISMSELYKSISFLKDKSDIDSVKFLFLHTLYSRLLGEFATLSKQNLRCYRSD